MKSKALPLKFYFSKLILKDFVTRVAPLHSQGLGDRAPKPLQALRLGDRGRALLMRYRR